MPIAKRSLVLTDSMLRDHFIGAERLMPTTFFYVFDNDDVMECYCVWHVVGSSICSYAYLVTV